MVCFPILVKPENRSELNGIIKRIRRSTNPLKYIEPTTGSGSNINGDVKTLVLWNDYFRAKVDTKQEEAWVQLDFKHLRIYPTSYALRGLTHEWEAWYGRKWSVYGIKENDIDNEDKWKHLGTHESVAGKYCGNSALCLTNGSIDTFDVVNEEFDGFRYIRYVSKQGSSELKWFVATAIEVYGLLINPNKCVMTCKFRNKITISMFVLHMLSG